MDNWLIISFIVVFVLSLLSNLLYLGLVCVFQRRRGRSIRAFFSQGMGSMKSFWQEVQAAKQDGCRVAGTLLLAYRMGGVFAYGLGGLLLLHFAMRYLAS